MSRKAFLVWLAVLAVGLHVGVTAQTQKLIVLQHADSLVGRVIDGEDARELIGNVLITQENVQIECDRALQFIRAGKVLLTGHVVVHNDSLTLRSPRGLYFRDERRAEAFDDVYLDDGKVRLSAKYGEYFIDERRAYFHTDVVVIDTASVIRADSLTYWRATQRSLGLGKVRVYSPRDRLTIYGGRLDHDAPRQYSRMTINPILVQIDSVSGARAETLQVRGLVLEAFRDSTQRLIATDSVEMVRTDLAATCRRACYYVKGDSIHLRTVPVLWYKETQLTGDSIDVFLKKRKLHRLIVQGNAFAVSRNDSLRPERMDQITGDRLAMLFGEEGLQRMDVEGRAISLYHLYDDSLANGLNKTSGDRIVMLFANGKAETIDVFGGVEGQYVPENLVRNREKEYALPGMLWRSYRPRQVKVTPFVMPPLFTKALYHD